MILYLQDTQTSIKHKNLLLRTISSLKYNGTLNNILKDVIFVKLLN